MAHLAVIAAAFMAVLVVRKLVPGLVARGVRPFSCDVCMSAWLALFFRMDALAGCGLWDWTGWFAFLRVTAACAAGAFLLLRAYRTAEMRFGLPDLDGPRPSPDSFNPPEGSDGA